MSSWASSRVHFREKKTLITSTNITTNNNKPLIGISHINRFNLFNYSINNTNIVDGLYIIGENNILNSKTVLSVKDDRIVINSNEWLHLLDKFYFTTKGNIYIDIVNKYNDIIHRTSTTKINESVVSLITSFCIGTAHGYCGLFCLLSDYLKNHIDKKIILYKNSQKGILDIVYHILKQLYKEDFQKYIIILDHNIVYNINEITFITNKHHTYEQSADFREEVTNILSTYIYPTLNTKQYYTNLINSNSIESHVCIFKSTNTQNVTNSSIIPFSDIQLFCTKNDATFIEPSDYNEIDVIGILFYCKKFSTMLNNCFHKNFIYIGNDCTEIDVYVISNESLYEYTQLKNKNELITNFKNAKINYIIQSKLE